MSLDNLYRQTKFLKSAARIEQLPADLGYEVAFAGRSNAGKSSALNCLTDIKQLARTSKTPGRTQLINLFTLDESRRLVDLPGYGYAKVSLKIKDNWQKNLFAYISTRCCLKGLILLMDSRHPLKALDQNMINVVLERELPVHILLTKADKLSKNAIKNVLLKVRKQYDLLQDAITVQSFSSLKQEGIPELINKLNQWFVL